MAFGRLFCKNNFVFSDWTLVKSRDESLHAQRGASFHIHPSSLVARAM
jgi:hypothetical protein